MTKFQPYVDFTAQQLTVRALMSLYSRIEDRDLQEIDLLPFIVFMAFSIEAYLNSVGSRHIQYWEELERLPWKNKISILHKNSGKQMNWGEEPLQFCSQVFKIRDKLAHGKPERVTGPVCSSHAEAFVYISGKNTELEPEWYKILTKEWVIAARDRYELLMAHIASLYSLGNSDHLHATTGTILQVPEGAT